MRKLLYFLLAILVVGKPEVASACFVDLENYEQHLARASTVFVAHIVRAEKAGTIQQYKDAQPEPAVEATLRVVGVLKGQPPADGKVRLGAKMSGTRGCNARLLAGHDYAIFLDHDNIIWGTNSGTAHLWHAQDIDAKRLLEHLREQEEEEHERHRERVGALEKGKPDVCPDPIKTETNFEQRAARASTVFLAHLTRTEEVGSARVGDAPPALVVEASFQVLEVMKGQAPPDGKVRTLIWNTLCWPYRGQPWLVPGNDFLVFLDQENLTRDGMIFLGDHSASYTRLGMLRDVIKKSR